MLEIAKVFNVALLISAYKRIGPETLHEPRENRFHAVFSVQFTLCYVHEAFRM